MNDFKKGVDAEDGRRRREETQLNLRKQKKNDRLTKRRLANSQATQVKDGENNAGELPGVAGLVSSIVNTNAPFDQLIKGVRGIRRLLSSDRNPPFKEVIDSGAIKPLVECLMRTDSAELQFEAAWALTNLASSKYTSSLAEYPNAVNNLVQLLRSENPDVREQCAWCLGNIAGDGTHYRDAIIELNAMEALQLNIQQPANESLLSNVIWTVSNLCRAKPKPDLAKIRIILPDLLNVLRSWNSLNAETVQDALWALSYVSDGDDIHINAVLETGGSELLQILVGILRTGVSGDNKLLAPSLRILGNFASGTEIQTQAVIDAGVLDVAIAILDMPNKNLRKEMCWLLSNIAAGTPLQIDSFVRTKHLAERVVELATDSEWQTKKEAIWTVSNVCTGGSDSHISALIENNTVEAMSSVLDLTGESRMIIVALDALKSIFEANERQGLNYLHIFDECGGIEKLEDLQSHTDNVVYEKAIGMIDEFFGEEDNEDENLAPKFDENGFTFGMESPPPAKTLFSEDNSNTFSASTFGQSTYNFSF